MQVPHPQVHGATDEVAQILQWRLGPALLSKKRPDIEWVGEQWPAQGRLEAGPTVDALAAIKDWAADHDADLPQCPSDPGSSDA